MRGLFKTIWWIISLPFRIVWKLRKLLMLSGGAAAGYSAWQKRKSEADTDSNETSAD